MKFLTYYINNAMKHYLLYHKTEKIIFHEKMQLSTENFIFICDLA